MFSPASAVDRIVGAEYCCGISPPTSPGFCLHMAMFYRRCTHNHPNHPNYPHGRPMPGQNPTLNPTGPFSSTMETATAQPRGSSSTIIPVAPGPCQQLLQSRIPRMGRYQVFRLVYEEEDLADDDTLTFIHHYSLFILTGISGSVRGLYLHVIGGGSPTDNCNTDTDTDMTFTETPGDIPERHPFPSAGSSSSSSPSPPGQHHQHHQHQHHHHRRRRSPVLLSSTPVGTIAVEDYDLFRHLSSRVPPPRCQFHGSRPLCPWTPPRRSREWAQDVINMAISQRVLDVSVAAVMPDPAAARGGIRGVLNPF